MCKDRNTQPCLIAGLRHVGNLLFKFLRKPQDIGIEASNSFFIGALIHCPTWVLRSLPISGSSHR